MKHPIDRKTFGREFSEWRYCLFGSMSAEEGGAVLFFLVVMLAFLFLV